MVGSKKHPPTSDEAFDLAFDMEKRGELVPRTLFANAQRTEQRILKQDLIEIEIEKTDLREFQFVSGRLNRRALARKIQTRLIDRGNQSRLTKDRQIGGIGLRTIELQIKKWEESENS